MGCNNTKIENKTSKNPLTLSSSERKSLDVLKNPLSSKEKQSLCRYWGKLIRADGGLELGTRIFQIFIFGDEEIKNYFSKVSEERNAYSHPQSDLLKAHGKVVIDFLSETLRKINNEMQCKSSLRRLGRFHTGLGDFTSSKLLKIKGPFLEAVEAELTKQGYWNRDSQYLFQWLISFVLFEILRGCRSSKLLKR